MPAIPAHVARQPERARADRVGVASAEQHERERRIAAGTLCRGSNSLTRTLTAQINLVPCFACAGVYTLHSTVDAGGGWVRGRLPDHLQVAR